MTSPLPGRLAVLASIALLSPAGAGDWPAWRYDAGRSAATPDDLPAVLHPHWTLTLPALKPAWPDQPLMPFDAAYEPVVAGRLMFVGSSRTDSVTAYDTRTGESRWRFLADGPVRFAASIWPFMGVFIHALDAETGRVVWTNDADGSMYIKQPHGADSFAGVAPQGPMAVAGDLLLVPSGRSVPAAYDRKTGKLRQFLLNENSKKGGGHTVAVAGDVFFNGPGVFLTKTGKYLGDASPLTVTGGDVAFTCVSNEVRALDVAHAEIKP